MKTLCKITIILISLVLSAPLVFAESQQRSGVTAQTIIDYARWEYLNESSEDFYDDDTRLLSILNRGVLDIVALTKCLETSETITLQTGVTEYSLSSNYLSVEKAVYSGATVSTRTNPLKGLKRVDIKDLAHSDNPGEPSNYYIWEDNMGIDPYPSSSVTGYYVYVYLVERPTSIGLTGTVPTPAIYDHALTLFVAAQALRKDNQMNKSNALMQEYMLEIARYRQDYIDSLRKPTEKRTQP